MALYLDASALVPTLVREPSSPLVAALLANSTEPPIVSDLAAAEVTSALSRLVRMKILAHSEADTLLREFSRWRRVASTGLDLTPADFSIADLFLRRFDLGLRTPDALHAAACRRGDHTLVTLDQHLAAAAQSLGLVVTCPG